MMLRHVLLFLVAISRLTRAEYKWTGSEWVYLEPDRKEIEAYDGSGGDDEDYGDYGDYDTGDAYSGSTGVGGSGGNTGFIDQAGGGNKNKNQNNNWGADTFNQPTFGGIDSSKFNFVRPGITDDEDFFEGSGDASVPLGGGQFGGGQGGRPLGGGSSSGRLPIDSFDDGVEGSGEEDGDLEQYPFGGNPSLNIPSTPQRTPQTTTTTTTQSPPIVIEDHNTGGGEIYTPDQTYGGFGNNDGASFNPGWPTSGNNKPTNPSDDDYYDEDYPPYTYDDDEDDNISIDQPGNPIDNVPDFINPQPQPPPQSGNPATQSPYFPIVPEDSSTARPSVPEQPAAQPPIVTDTVPTNRPVSFFAQPGILAAVIGGAVVGLLCAILLVMFIVYRMRKKDEGSYILDEPKRVHNGNVYTKTPNREFYA